MIDKEAMLDELHEMANRRGGRCLSDRYINSTSKLQFKCKNGHYFESSRNAVKAGNWCPFCAGRRQTIRDLQELARQRGGSCLSPQYMGVEVKHLWQCSEGHQWEAVPRNIKSLGRWCPTCGRNKCDRNRRKYTLKDMHELAHSFQGLCLSTHFESVIKKLTWQCSEGHIWDATPHNIQQGNRCPVCASKIRAEKRKTHTIEEMHTFAKDKGGKCLSSVFNQVKDSLLWECLEGHQWKANADNIINGGKWCPVCAGNQSKTIEDMQKLAEKRGGKCLSTQYSGINRKLLWECSEGHQWETIPSVISRGGWCPICKAGLGERICREFFEQIFQHPFKKGRPSWLRNQRGFQMELDGYSPTLKLAFEHQGSQHYENIKYFKKSSEKLNVIRENDRQKVELCRDNGVILIVVPSVLEMLGIEGVMPFLRSELLKNNIEIPSGINAETIDLKNAFCSSKLEELKTIASERGGSLISQQYFGIFEKLEWECSQGHQFKAVPNNVKNSGTWCPKCLGRGKTIMDMELLASSRGGHCLSGEYINSITPLLWECKDGHQWNARPNNILFGTWCPVCAKKRRGRRRAL